MQRAWHITMRIINVLLVHKVLCRCATLIVLDWSAARNASHVGEMRLPWSQNAKQ